MKRFFFLVLFLVFFTSVVFGKDADDSDADLKMYLSDMNKVFIGIEETIRNFSIRMMPPETALKQIVEGIKKFQELKAPPLFSKDHYDMLASFELMREGFKLLSEGKKDQSVALVRKGADLLKETALRIKATAERKGLIPVRQTSNGANKPILPPQPVSLVPGVTPTPSPHIASPDLGSVAINDNTRPGKLFITGKIISVESREDYLVMTLKDNSGSSVSIDVNPRQCNIMKDNNAVKADEIKEDGLCYIAYTENNKKNQAAFVLILNPEEKLFMVPQPTKP